MISYIQGRLVEKNPTEVVVDCHGVGYHINISLNTFSQLPDSEQVKLFVHLLVREDSHTLYGFCTRQEREVFRLLISVSGVGASTARAMLSSMTSMQVIEAIGASDVVAIQAVKGIGAKTAQRMILDLKDRVLKVYDIDEVSHAKSNTNKEEALSALEVLGFARKQSERTVDGVLKRIPDASVEDLIKESLKNL